MTYRPTGNPPGRPAAPDSKCVEAYWLYIDGELDMSLREIARRLPNDDGSIPSPSTVREWIARGMAIEAEHSGPLRRRRARRDQLIRTQMRRHATLARDIDQGLVDRLGGYDRLLKIEQELAKLQALYAAQKVQVTGAGGKPVQVDPGVLATLAAVPIAELLPTQEEAPE